jgi:death-on-curing protein
MTEPEILRGYYILADYFSDTSGGGSAEPMTIGLRENGHLLASAVGRQVVKFESRLKYEHNLDVCATLFYGLTKNHAFLDGNKRIALLSLLSHLIKCGYYPSESIEDFEALVLAVAANDLKESYPMVHGKLKDADGWEVALISALLKRMTKKKDHSYHTNITMSEFAAALRRNGATCELEANNKIRCAIDAAGAVKRYSISFMGWTRPVGATQARECLSVLGLYDQHATYQNFVEKRPSFYSLISKYEEPLRRLKDK